MKPINAAAATFVIPCYSPSKESASRLLAAWGGLAALGVSLETFTDGESFVRRLRELDQNKVPVPVVWVEGPLDVKAVEWGGRLRELPVGWSQSQLQSELRGALTAYLMESVPGELERFSEWLDPSLLARAFRDLHASKQALDSQMDALRSGLTGMASASDKTVEEALIEGIDLALDRPARQAFKPGEVLLKEGEPVHGIWIVLDGEVELLRRARQREIVFHSQSAGRIVGLIALAQRRQAFHTCRAKTNVTVAFLTWEQLDRALRKDPWLTVHLVSVLVKSMTRRLRKIGRLQLQVEDLNDILAAERDQLSQALQRLEQAQIRLIESEKMATLGQLSAGVAHELNNPITAIRRVSDYIAEDLDALVRSCPDEKLIRGFMSSAMTEAPPSTAEIRRRAAELSILTGGAAEAGRLAKLGITDQKEYRQWCGEVSPERREARLSLMERAHELGLSLRSLRASADRVVAIVGSLKSYARPDHELSPSVDIPKGIDDTLILFGPSLIDVEVVRNYQQVPPIACRSTEMNQVWTNLIGNALDAMRLGDTPAKKLLVEADSPDARHVRVRVIDNGPGIPKENAERVFDLNFTTKHGPASFGLGMGLTICRQIVSRHGGNISIDSKPGRTCVSVVLPVNYLEKEEGL